MRGLRKIEFKFCNYAKKKGASMKRYVIRRLLMAIPLLLAISFVCFVFINLIPSNPAEVVLRIQQTPIITDEAIAEMEEALGLNNLFWCGILTGSWAVSRGISASAMSIPPAQSPENWPAACRHAAVGGGLVCDRAAAEHPYRLPLRCVQGWLV